MEQFKSYEHFHLKTLTGQNDAGQSLITIVGHQWLDNVKIYKYANFDPKIPCGSRVMSIFTS